MAPVRYDPFQLSFGVEPERRSARQLVELSEKGGVNSEADSQPRPEPEPGLPHCAAKFSFRDRAIRRCRRSVQRLEICDQVGALGVVFQAGVDHRRVGHHRARIGEVLIETGGVPCDAELLVAGGVLEARNAARRTANHAEQCRATRLHPPLPSGRCRTAP